MSLEAPVDSNKENQSRKRTFPALQVGSQDEDSIDQQISGGLEWPPASRPGGFC